MVETLAYIAANPKLKRAMQEEYWAAQNEIIRENQVTTLTKENAAKDKQIATLRHMLQQAGITIPSA
jgi:hypothetical protein